MGKTNDLRKLVREQLKEICTNVYYEIAADDKMYPHIVFSFDSCGLEDLNRQDLILNIDLWDKSGQAVAIEDLSDALESIFNNQNMPQDTILPTFFLIDRKAIPDEDKKIRHRLIRVLVQNYKRSEG